MLCHPHNPVGTLFRENELRDLIEWLVQRELYLCSDEIHCDLILEKAIHFTCSLGRKDIKKEYHANGSQQNIQYCRIWLLFCGYL